MLHLTKRIAILHRSNILAEAERQAAERREAQTLTTPFPFEPGTQLSDINVVKFYDQLQVYVGFAGQSIHRALPDTAESRQLIAAYAANAQYRYGLAKGEGSQS